MDEVCETHIPKLTQLSPKQAKYLALMNEFKNQSECAVFLGVTRRTLYNWRKSAMFQHFLDKVNQEVMQDVIQKRVEKICS